MAHNFSHLCFLLLPGEATAHGLLAAARLAEDVGDAARQLELPGLDVAQDGGPVAAARLAVTTWRCFSKPILFPVSW